MPGAAGRQFTARLVPLALILAAAGAWMAHVQSGGPWLVRNLMPLALLFALSGYALHRGRGRFTGSGWCLPLGVAGFAIPTLGLTLYLHYAYAVNLDGMFDGGAGALFRFLPYYTMSAGAIGFTIGWLIGRNVG